MKFMNAFVIEWLIKMMWPRVRRHNSGLNYKWPGSSGATPEPRATVISSRQNINCITVPISIRDEHLNSQLHCEPTFES